MPSPIRLAVPVIQTQSSDPDTFSDCSISFKKNNIEPSKSKLATDFFSPNRGVEISKIKGMKERTSVKMEPFELVKPLGKSSFPAFGTVLKTAIVGLAFLGIVAYGALAVRVGGIPEAQVAVKAVVAKTFNYNDIMTIAESPRLASFFRQWNDFVPNGWQIDVNKACEDCGPGLDQTLLFIASHNPTNEDVLTDLLKAPMEIAPPNQKWNWNLTMKQWNTDDTIGFITSSLVFKRYDLLEDALKFGWIRADLLTPDQHFQILENAAQKIGNPRGIQFVKDFIASSSSSLKAPEELTAGELLKRHPELVALAGGRRNFK